MIRAAGFVMALLVLIASAPAADNPQDAAGALERKLHGAWIGGPCDGEFTLKPDGTFERRHYSPGNYTVTGTWKVQWDALPPTLVLSCRTSDDPDAVGKISEVKLIQLNDKVLTYQYPGQRLSRYTRTMR